MCKIKKKQNLKRDTNLTKEGSFSTTHCSNNCKHISSNFKCQTHKRNAIEVTKIWQVFNIDSNVLCAECEMVYIYIQRQFSCLGDLRIDDEIAYMLRTVLTLFCISTAAHKYLHT